MKKYHVEDGGFTKEQQQEIKNNAMYVFAKKEPMKEHNTDCLKKLYQKTIHLHALKFTAHHKEIEKQKVLLHIWTMTQFQEKTQSAEVQWFPSWEKLHATMVTLQWFNWNSRRNHL